jgi:Fe-S cluster assembly scaffold protein SufB
MIIRKGKKENLSLPVKPGESEIEIILEPGSELNLAYIQNGPANGESAKTIRIILHEGSRLNSFFAMIGCARAGLKLETHLEGRGSSVTERTLYFGSGEQVFEMVSNTILHAPDTKAEIISKGILNEKAQARFDGNIHIQQTAKHADARLIEHTLLLSPQARMNAIPGLKIDTNDVLATHSASMTRVDDEQLFYCKSRGIEEEEAIRLIAEGFLAGLYNKYPLKQNVYQLIEKKLCKV